MSTITHHHPNPNEYLSERALWEAFSTFIRLRDSDGEGFCTCITCGRVRYWRNGDCGHGVPRQHQATKYHEWNNHFQCKHCNGFEEGAKDRYREVVNQRYGPQTWELLVLASKKPHKRSRFETHFLAIHYRARAEELAGGKRLKPADQVLKWKKK